MTWARLRLAISFLAFVGWLTWLAVAVAQKDDSAKVSRAQLTAASLILIGEVSQTEDGLPAEEIQITQVIRSQTNQDITGKIRVVNLPSSKEPGRGFLGPGNYLLCLIPAGEGTYSIAGLPRTPGAEATIPEIPSIYSWTPAVEAQLRELGLWK